MIYNIIYNIRYNIIYNIIYIYINTIEPRFYGDFLWFYRKVGLPNSPFYGANDFHSSRPAHPLEDASGASTALLGGGLRNPGGDQTGPWISVRWGHMVNGNFRILKWRYVSTIRPYFGGIFPYIGLKNRPYIWNRYLHFRILKFPLILGCFMGYDWFC